MISDVIMSHLIDSLPPTIMASGAVYLGIVNRRGIKDNKESTVEVGRRVDGRMDEMLRLAKEGSFAAGVKHEVDHPGKAPSRKARR